MPCVIIFDSEGNIAFCYVLHDGLGVVAFCDTEYPDRVAMSMLRKVLGNFQAAHGETWKGVKDDYGAKLAGLEELLREYQDPAAVDKLMKLDRQLLETKEVLHKTVEAVLARGEKLDGEGAMALLSCFCNYDIARLLADLIVKSDQLSSQSKLFYRQARKTNSCCEIM